MYSDRSPKVQLLAQVDPSVKERLAKRALKRSFELGQRVGVSFVLKEILDQLDQLENPDQREAELYAAHE